MLDSRASAVSGTTIPKRLAHLAERQPASVAISSHDVVVTYDRLWRRVQRAATALIANGLSVGDVVAIRLERGVDMVVSLAAIASAGASYVAVSPDEPEAYADMIVASSRARFVMRGTGEECEALDRGGPATAFPLWDTASDGDTLLPDVSPDDLAYIIYTSGSTGTPRGVGVTHRNIVNLVSRQTYARFGPGESFLQLAPLAFDASAFEIWGALLSGATLVLATPSYTQLESLSRALRDHRVTNLLLTPALFHQLSSEQLDDPYVRRRLLVGGDAMAASHAATFAAQAANTQLFNVYGPTEGTTLVTAYPVDSGASLENGVPLGASIEGTAVRLLDSELRIVTEPGEVGELAIGGDSVAMGYLGRPADTATSFVPDPYSSVAGSRMYLTGDLAALGEDGELRFVGRRDDQVKVRGYRVELGQVESLLAGCPAVAFGAVITAGDTPEDRHLVAHVVLGDADGAVDEVRRWMAARAPAHLIPSRIEVHDALPITRTGKVDKRSLAAGAWSASEGGTQNQNASEVRDEDVLPEERALLSVWRAVLNAPELGPSDDFFASGGDSLLALRVIQAAEDAGLRFDIASLFQHPTVRELARLSVTYEPSNALANEAIKASTQMPRREVSATKMQQGLIYESLLGGADAPVFIGVVERAVSGAFDEDAFLEAVALSIKNHPVLRVAFDLATREAPVQVVQDHRFGMPVEIERVPFRSAEEREMRRNELASTPIDVEVGPLIRLIVTVHDPQAFSLTYVFHHAVLDGWSETVLTRELLGAYDALLAGEEPRQHATSIEDYASNVEVEGAALRSAVTTEFWSTRLASVKSLLIGVKSDEQRRSVTVPVELGKLDGRIREAARSAQAPVKSVLLAAHMITLGEWTGQSRPVSGLVVNARPEVAGADSLIGMFLNFLPFSLELQGKSALATVKAAVDEERAIASHRTFPYAALRDLAGRELFDTAFNYVRFHLNAELTSLRALRVTDPEIYSPTSETLFVDFIDDPVSRRLRMELEVDARWISGAELDRLVALYIDVMERLANDLAR